MVLWGLLLPATIGGTEAGIPWWGWLLIGIASAVCAGIILKVGSVWWNRFHKNYSHKKAAQDARFKHLNKDLTRLERHLSETRERRPGHISIGCLIDFTKGTWQGEARELTKEQLLGGPTNIPKKVQKRVDVVNTRYDEYRRALSAASKTCEDALSEIVQARFGQELTFPRKDLALFLGIWTDSVLETGCDLNEAADSMVEVFAQFYDSTNLLSRKRDHPKLPEYPAKEMTADLEDMIRRVHGNAEFKAQGNRLREAEKNLKQAVKAALASIT